MAAAGRASSYLAAAAPEILWLALLRLQITMANLHGLRRDNNDGRTHLVPWEIDFRGQLGAIWQTATRLLLIIDARP